MTAVRTRFAPSPTGFLHVGGVRTALFAWLVARQAGGQFILRLEDTDQAREVEGSDQHIMDSLKWLGIDWDEGPDKPGQYGPYRQSERLASYKKWARKLVDKGRAYADPYSPEELEALRQKAKDEKRPFLFRDHRPENPPKWDGSQPLRFKSEPKAYEWEDAVMGKLSAGPEAVDDFILIKTDGYPTYNFAHIIDDHLMACSHVIRSQEFIASTPRYLNLYEALEIERPILATVPFVMGPDGRKKLSKRDGAKDILDYAKDGFLPEAMMNFIATLGWNDGTTQELFTKEELVKKFQLDRVQTGGARFDEQRLVWMNGSYIRQLSIDELSELAEPFWPAEAKQRDYSYKKAALSLVQERLKHLSELPQLTSFFFSEPKPDLKLIKENKQLSKLPDEEIKSLLETTNKELEASSFGTEDLQNRLNQLLETTGQKPGILFSLIRVATTWAPASPPLADSLHLLGKNVSLNRLQEAIKLL